MFVDLKDYGFTQNEFIAYQRLKTDKDTVNSIPGRIIEARREQFNVVCEYGEGSPLEPQPSRKAAKVPLLTTIQLYSMMELINRRLGGGLFS